MPSLAAQPPAYLKPGGFLNLFAEEGQENVFSARNMLSGKHCEMRGRGHSHLSRTPRSESGFLEAASGPQQSAHGAVSVVGCIYLPPQTNPSGNRCRSAAFQAEGFCQRLLLTLTRPGQSQRKIHPCQLQRLCPVTLYEQIKHIANFLLKSRGLTAFLL